MRLYVTDAEAVRYWYTHRGAATLARVSITRIDPGTTVANAADLALAEKFLADAGIVAPQPGEPGTLFGPDATAADGAGCHHVLVPGTHHHGRCGNFVRHCCDGAIPPNAFVRVADGIYVTSPEYAWVRLAARLSRTRLIRLGCALCSTYRIADDGSIAYDGAAITTPARLAAFVDSAAGTYGARAARAALRYVVAGIASPTELAAYLLICLPPELGGAGMPQAKPNREIVVATHELAEAADRCDRHSYRIDLAWDEYDCGVEYLGRHHDQHVDADRARINALAAMGWRVLQIKYADLANVDLRLRFLSQLSLLLKTPLPKATSQSLAACDALLTELFGPLSPIL